MREQQWSIRIVHEASLYEGNQFVTLTYDEEHAPEDFSVSLEHHQLFMKRLRRKFKSKITFVMAAEYGGKLLRPHYHYALMNMLLTDLTYYDTTPQGHTLYVSELLTKAWGKGLAIVGELNPTTAGYIARYLLKAQAESREESKNTDWAKRWYYPDKDGVYQPRVEPFFQMSRNPGIAHDWIHQYMDDVFPADSILMPQKQSFIGKVSPYCSLKKPEPKGNIYIPSNNMGINARPTKTVFKEVPVPLYYLKQLEKVNPQMYQHMIAKRQAAILDPKSVAERTPERLKTKNTILISKLGKDKKETNEL